MGQVHSEEVAREARGGIVRQKSGRDAYQRQSVRPQDLTVFSPSGRAQPRATVAARDVAARPWFVGVPRAKPDGAKDCRKLTVVVNHYAVRPEAFLPTWSQKSKANTRTKGLGVGWVRWVKQPQQGSFALVAREP